MLTGRAARRARSAVTVRKAADLAGSAAAICAEVGPPGRAPGRRRVPARIASARASGGAFCRIVFITARFLLFLVRNAGDEGVHRPRAAGDVPRAVPPAHRRGGARPAAAEDVAVPRTTWAVHRRPRRGIDRRKLLRKGHHFLELRGHLRAPFRRHRELRQPRHRVDIHRCPRRLSARLRHSFRQESAPKWKAAPRRPVSARPVIGQEASLTLGKAITSRSELCAQKQHDQPVQPEGKARRGAACRTGMRCTMKPKRSSISSAEKPEAR